MHGRLLRNFVFERVKSAVDSEVLMQMQAELACAAMAAVADGKDPREVVRRTRRLIRRAWQRYGEEVVLLTREVSEAVVPAPG